VPVSYHCAENGFVIAGGGKSSAVHDVWDVLKHIINEVNKEMKYFLTSSFGVNELYPPIQQFDSLETFTACYVNCLKNTDSTYKHEAKHEKKTLNPNVINQDEELDEEDIEMEDRFQDREPSDDELKR